MERHYTIVEIADQLSISRQTVSKLCQTGEIQAVKIGRVYRIPQRALDLFLARALVQVGKEVRGETDGQVVRV